MSVAHLMTFITAFVGLLSILDVHVGVVVPEANQKGRRRKRGAMEGKKMEFTLYFPLP